MKKGCEEKMCFPIAQAVHDWSLGANEVNDGQVHMLPLYQYKQLL